MARHGALATVTGRVRAAGLLLVTLAAAGACGSGPPDEPVADDTTTSAAPRLDRFEEVAAVAAEEPAAMAVRADGSLLIGERRSGRILEVPAADLAEPAPEPREIARVEVATDGQQGLLGLAVTRDGDLLAGLTLPGPGEPRQALVRVVSDSEPVVLWRGPVAAERAIGGRIAVAPDGRVVMGLGDFLTGAADEPPGDEPYSTLIALDPDGPPDQEPRVLSRGWYNPFAFTVAPDGAVWVADNSPGEAPERIGRGDGGGPLRDLEGRRAPSGLALASPDELAVCGVVSGLLELVPVVDGEAAEPAGVLAEPCRLGVLALPDGRLAVAVEDQVRILAPTGPG